VPYTFAIMLSVVVPSVAAPPNRAPPPRRALLPVLHVRQDDGQGLVDVDDDLQVGREVPLRSGKGFKTFYVRNLQIFIISCSVCPR
jgi:hypothetical protein